MLVLVLLKEETGLKIITSVSGIRQVNLVLVLAQTNCELAFPDCSDS